MDHQFSLAVLYSFTLSKTPFHPQGNVSSLLLANYVTSCPVWVQEGITEIHCHTGDIFHTKEKCASLKERKQFVCTLRPFLFFPIPARYAMEEFSLLKHLSCWLRKCGSFCKSSLVAMGWWVL